MKNSKHPDPRFQYAITLEKAYVEAVAGFDDDAPPFYEASGRGLDLDRCRQSHGVERSRCIIALDRHGALHVARDYEGVDVTLLQGARIQLSRMSQSASSTTPRQ